MFLIPTPQSSSCASAPPELSGGQADVPMKRSPAEIGREIFATAYASAVREGSHNSASTSLAANNVAVIPLSSPFLPLVSAAAPSATGVSSSCFVAATVDGSMSVYAYSEKAAKILLRPVLDLPVFLTEKLYTAQDGQEEIRELELAGIKIMKMPIMEIEKSRLLLMETRKQIQKLKSNMNRRALAEMCAKGEPLILQVMLEEKVVEDVFLMNIEKVCKDHLCLALEGLANFFSNSLFVIALFKSTSILVSMYKDQNPFDEILKSVPLSRAIRDLSRSEDMEAIRLLARALNNMYQHSYLDSEPRMKERVWRGIWNNNRYMRETLLLLRDSPCYLARAYIWPMISGNILDAQINPKKRDVPEEIAPFSQRAEGLPIGQ